MYPSANEAGQLWRLPREKVIFLGFDGVLHELTSASFERLPLLEGFLRLHPQISLVIASDWRRAPRAILEELFSEDIRSRLAGCTAQEGLFSLRSTEVQLWAHRNRVVDFVSLDAQPDRFRREWRHQLITQSPSGLSLYEIRRLQHWAETSTLYGGLSA
ncbi:MAG: HAD domain-containing protein [Pseudomonadota bacterium]